MNTIIKDIINFLNSLVFILIISNQLFLLFSRILEIHFKEFNISPDNYAFYFEQIPHEARDTICKIPLSNIEKAVKHFSEQKLPKYPFFHCAPELRNYLDDDAEVCVDWKQEKNSRILHTKDYTLKNVIGNLWGSWSIGNTLVKIRGEDYHFFRWPWMYDACRSGLIVAHFHEVILTGHFHSRFNFGHCLTDLIAPILLLPEDVRERSYVIGSPHTSFPNEFLRIIGFKEQQIIILKNNSWFYADRLHAFSKWRPLANINGDMNVIINRVLIEKLNLSHIVPTKYTINNRKGKRGIKNVDELLKAIQEKHPDKEWNILYTFSGNISSYAYMYTEIKFLVAPVGSNLFNMGFMKPYTILCIGSSQCFDFYSVFFAVSSYHYFYFFPVPGLNHFASYEWDWNISIALKAISEALYCERYGHFPYITEIGGYQKDIREK